MFLVVVFPSFAVNSELRSFPNRSHQNFDMVLEAIAYVQRTESDKTATNSVIQKKRNSPLLPNNHTNSWLFLLFDDCSLYLPFIVTNDSFLLPARPSISKLTLAGAYGRSSQGGGPKGLRGEVVPRRFRPCLLSPAIWPKISLKVSKSNMEMTSLSNSCVSLTHSEIWLLQVAGWPREHSPPGRCKGGLVEFSIQNHLNPQRKKMLYSWFCYWLTITV